VARFNERFILSLGDCRSSIVMDDRLNILPLSSHMQKIEPLPHHYEVVVIEFI
jgi:N-acetyltransferase 10